MTAVTEDQDAPAVALQPLTSGGNTPVCQEGRDGDAEVGEEGPLTTIIQDGRPGAHMNGDVLQLGQRPKKRKYLETVVLYTGFLILGLSYGIQGPSILDLQLAVHTDTKTITRIFIGRALGGLSGALLSGLVLEKFDCYVLYGFANFMMTAFLALLPWTWHVIIMAITLALSSTAGGFCDAAGNMCLLMVWDTDNGPWMQALHFIFALGALLGPLVVKPFLKEVPRAEELFPKGKHGDGANVTLADVGETTAGVHVTLADVGGTTTPVAPDELCIAGNCTNSPQYPDLGTDVWIPFLLIGAMGIIITCFFFGLFCTKSPEWSNKRKKENKVEGQIIAQNRLTKNFLIFSVFVFYVCSCATEIGFQSYVFAFAVDHHGWHKSDAAVLTSVTFTTFMLGRVAGIFVIHCFRPAHVLVFDCVGLVISNIPMAFFSHSHAAVIWVSCALNGWFVSRLFATGITWMDRYIRISGIVATIFMVAGSTGDMLGPIVLTALYGNFGLGSFAPLMLVSSSAVLLVCLLMMFVAHKLGPRNQTTSVEVPNEVPNSTTCNNL